MNTDEATHEITRILKRLYRENGSLICSVVVDWNLEPGGRLTKPTAKMVRVQLTSVIQPGSTHG